MKYLEQNISRSYWEIPFQVFLCLLVFVFYSFDSESESLQIEPYKLVFFLNYVVAVFIINYFLLPRFLYRKQYWQFFVGFLLILLVVIFIEEEVLEKIYFADSRGQTFQGIFLTLLDIIPIITILSGFKFAWDVIRKHNEVERLKLSIEESELSFLKSQINPHFLFNNLNNLYSYALEKSSKTPQIILELSSVLRYMLYECREKYVWLNKELENLRNYVQLYELQIEERGEVEFTAPELSARRYRIAPLILVVFVENAFKHSVSSQGESIVIRINIDISDAGVLTFTCENSFAGQSNVENVATGIGLINVRKRLEYIYPDSHSLDIREQSGMYFVELKIDLNQKSDE